MTAHRFLRTASAVLFLSATIAVSPACAAPRGRLYVRVGPAAPIVETRIVAPGPGYVWVSGYHRWSGAAYVWVPGHWVWRHRTYVWAPGYWAVPVVVGHRWVPGQWVARPGGYVWIEGHWR